MCDFNRCMQMAGKVWDSHPPDGVWQRGSVWCSADDIYREDIVFRDPRNTFKGLKNYKTIFWSLRFHGRLFFSRLYVDVQRIWQPDEAQIRQAISTCSPIVQSSRLEVALPHGMVCLQDHSVNQSDSQALCWALQDALDCSWHTQGALES